MNSQNKYVLLQERLDAFPTGNPASPAFDEILHILFSDDEVDLALHMSITGNTAEEIADRSGIPLEEVRTRLEQMADKVVIYSRRIKDKLVYGLVPSIPGLFEFQFMKGGGTPMHDKLAPLWERYKHEAQAEAFDGKPTPMMRIVPAHKSLEHQNVVLPYDEVRNLIDQASYISLSECACRVSKKKCNKPTDVCIGFGYMGEFLVDKGYARHITKEEAIATLDKADESGLVHCTNNSQDGPAVICNCCSCCCTILRGRTELNMKNHFSPSRYTAQVKNETCIGCGFCITDRCPNKAISLNDDGIAVVNKNDCIGCGLCVTGCPAGAMELIQREQEIDTPKTSKELILQVLKEKGKLENFLKIMK